ncbi:hypothetical protein niasHT_009845 [Heterodera trifolii]|uniref:Integrase catalytic domain-containing protein n=1 Tax=Heterodera trifolii TaxID=157864 RepID=A0ABD2LRL5_9BILA
MANKFLIIPEVLYRGLTSASSTGDINLDAVRQELDRTKMKKVNANAKNVQYNQQLRRYLHMRKEHSDRPTKVELSKGLSVLFKRDDGDEDMGVADVPQHPPGPPPPDQHPRPSLRPPSPPDGGHSPPNNRPPRPPRPPKTRKTRRYMPVHQWRLRQRNLQEHHLQLPQPEQQQQQAQLGRNLLTEATAAPLYDNDDDDYMLEDGYTLPAPSQHYEEPMLPDYEDEIDEMDTARYSFASRRKMKGENGAGERTKKYKVYYSPPPSPKPPPRPTPKREPKQELKQQQQTPTLRQIIPPAPPPQAKREPKYEQVHDSPPPPPPAPAQIKREPKYEQVHEFPPYPPPPQMIKREPKQELSQEASTSSKLSIPQRELKKEPQRQQQQHQQQQEQSTSNHSFEGEEEEADEAPPLPRTKRNGIKHQGKKSGERRVRPERRRGRAKVEYSPTPKFYNVPSTSTQKADSKKYGKLFSIPPNKLTMKQRVERILIKCNHYGERMGVSGNSLINEETGKPYPRSNVSMIIKYIIDKRAGKATKIPPRSKQLEEKLKLDPILYSWTARLKKPPPQTKPKPQSTYKKPFRPERLLEEAKKRISDVQRSDVVNYLEGHRTYTLLRPRRVHFPRSKTVAAGFMTDVQVDLADLQSLSRRNKGYRYLLVAVDVLSKRLFVVPLRSKRADEMLLAFNQLVEQMPMTPHRVFTDKGTEFRNRALKEFFEEHDIAKHEPVHSAVKASVAERAIRNVKQRLYRYFAQKETLNWIDVVQRIADGINRAPSRVHGMRPIDVNFSNAQKVWHTIYGDMYSPMRKLEKRTKFKENDYVRMSREKGQFEKGYLPNYGDEILEIDDVLRHVNPVRYKLRDEKGEQFKGSFYDQELARVRKDAETSYRIEKVVRKRKRADGSTEMLVKFIGSDAVERQRVIRVPVPKGSHKKVEQLRDFIVATLRHQSSTIEQLKNETQTKSTSSNTNTFIERPRLLSPSSPPPSERRKRSLGETLTSPPTHEKVLVATSPPRADQDTQHLQIDSEINTKKQKIEEQLPRNNNNNNSTSQIPSSTSLPPLPVLKPVVNKPTIANTAPAIEKVAKAVASGKQTDTTGSAPVSSAFPHKNIITNNQPNTNNKVASTKTPAPPPPLSATTTPKVAQSQQAVGAATKPKLTQSQQTVGAATKPKVTQSQQAAAAATTSTTITVNKATTTAKPTASPSPPVAPATTTTKAAKAAPVERKEFNENAAGVDVVDIMLGGSKQSVVSGEEKQQQPPKTNVSVGRPLMSPPPTDSKDVLDIMLGGPKQSIARGEEKKQQQQPPKPNVTIVRPLVSPPPTESKDVLDIMLGEPKQSVVNGEEKQQQPQKPNVTIGRPLMSPPATEPKDVIDDLFGIVPKTGEKNRAQLFLNEMLGGSDEKEKGPPLELLKHIIDSVEIQYHLDFERFKIVFHDPAITGLSFSPQLGYVLGFEYPQNVRNSEIAKYGCDLRGGFSSFAVYSNGLTENMIIGNSLSSLLRVVSVTGAVSGEYNEKIYDSPIYARVLPREISEIEIELRTMDNGRLVPFAFGTTMVVLIFKKYGSGVLGDEKEMAVFKGSSPFQRGYGTQRGAGVGDVFRGLWRFFLPILRRVGTTVGTEALNTGQRVLERENEALTLSLRKVGYPNSLEVEATLV